MGRIIEIVLLGSVLLVGAPAWGQVKGLQQRSSAQSVPVMGEPRPPELKTQMHRARVAFESGASMMEAKVRVERVLEERPDDVDARKLRARVLLALGRPVEARKDARRAAELAPKDGETYLLLAETARLEGDTTAARQAFDQAANRISDDAMLHVRLAWTAAHLSLFDRAEAYARTALALNASLPNAYYQLARVFVRKGQPDDAAHILARGLEASLLSTAIVQHDSLLRRLASHERLRKEF